MKHSQHSRSTGHGADSAPGHAPVRYWGRTLALFVILSLFWILLSGRVGVQYFLFMLASVGIILWMNPERPFRRMERPGKGGLVPLLRAGGHLARYLVWLLWNMTKANIEVARIILDPKLPIDPQFLIFETTLKREVARVLVANSITLTPGTITVDLSRGHYLVHALSQESAGAVTGGELQNVVGVVFGEDPDPAPDVRWVHTYEELGR